MALDGITWYYMVLHYIVWYLMLSVCVSQCGCLLHICHMTLIQPSGSRASRARAVTVSQCPHSEVGQDFLLRRRVTLTKTAVTRKRKVKKSIQRCQIDRLAKGYKRAIDKIRGPMAKNGFSGQNPARWPENGPPSGRTANKNRSEGAKSKISPRVTNGPLTKSAVL